MTTYYYKAGDTAPSLTQTLRAPAVVDLTTSDSVALIMRKLGVTAQVLPMVVVGPATDGTVRRVWEPGDLTEGSFHFYIRVTWADGSIQSFPSQGFGSIEVGSSLS